MKTEQKAEMMSAAAKELAEQYDAEGHTDRARAVVNAFEGLPTESAARLFDMIKAAV